jgi:hypothetical protein
MLYELIQPSDAVTFHAPDDNVARAVCLMLGNGQYGINNEAGEKVDAFLIFCGEEKATERLHSWFGPDVAAWMKAHEPEIAEALESVMTISTRERGMFERALSAIDDPAKRKAFRDETHDRNRSSMNNIAGRAWKLAAELRGVGEPARFDA